jgi:CDP-diacylglycerol--glycerol-3-phosphate 3-phosphatidyltransferase
MLPAADRFLTISNIVSIIRLLLTIPVAWALLTDQLPLAFWLCVVAAISDWLDGTVARATNTESEWGKILDPIADKVLVGVVVVIMLVRGLLPAWFVAAVVVRDVLILAGGAFAARYTPVVPPSLLSGKLAVSAIAGAGMAAILQWTLLRDVLMAAATVLMVLSLWHYGTRLHGIIRQAQENA